MLKQLKNNIEPDFWFYETLRVAVLYLTLVLQMLSTPSKDVSRSIASA